MRSQTSQCYTCPRTKHRRIIKWGLLLLEDRKNKLKDVILKISDSPKGLNDTLNDFLTRMFRDIKIDTSLNIIVFACNGLKEEDITLRNLSRCRTSRKCHVVCSGRLITRLNWLLKELIKVNPFYDNAIKYSSIINVLSKKKKMDLIRLYNTYCTSAPPVNIFTSKYKIRERIRFTLKYKILYFKSDDVEHVP